MSTEFGTIQLKRSSTLTTPTELAFGEAAWMANGEVLYIGDSSSNAIPIAGTRHPGTLTANQAIVTDSNSTVDALKTGTLYINAVPANAINSTSNSTVLGSNSNTELATTFAINSFVNNYVSTHAAAQVQSDWTESNTSVVGYILHKPTLGTMAQQSADSVAITGGTITGLGTPSGDTDAANKAYVDAVAQGLDPKDSVRVASTGNINIASPGATIDGVSLNSGDPVLLWQQTSGSQNGIYLWNGATSAMTRRSDANSSDMVTSGLYTYVSEGSIYAGNGFVLNTADPIILDSTSLSFTIFSGSGSFNAGTGLIKTGSTFSLANANSLTVKANITGGSAAPIDVTGSALLDSLFSSTQGSILYRGSSNWSALGVGSNGQYLQTQGASADPQWATVIGSGRTILTGTLDKYIDPSTGNDANSGDISSPWQSMTHAWKQICSVYDLAGQAIHVHCAAGNYPEGFSTSGDLTGPDAGFISSYLPVGGGKITFTGDTTTPANCTVGGSARTNSYIFDTTGNFSTFLTIEGFRFDGTNNAYLNLVGEQNGRVDYSVVINFDANYAVFFVGRANYLFGDIAVETALSCPLFYLADLSLVDVYGTISSGRVPAVAPGTAVIYMAGSSNLTWEANVTCTMTGKRFDLDAGSRITDFIEDDPTLIPGDVAGTTSGYSTYNGRDVPRTVATLDPPLAGSRAFVADATVTLAAGIGTVVVGGSTNGVPVVANGTSWLIG